MTYKEFKRHVFTIYSENYNGEDVSPIEYGIQRAKFEEIKLERLIVLAEQTDFSTAKRKVAGWRRQLERVHQIRARLEQRKTETMAADRFYARIEPTVPVRIHDTRRSSPMIIP